MIVHKGEHVTVTRDEMRSLREPTMRQIVADCFGITLEDVQHRVFGCWTDENTCVFTLGSPQQQEHPTNEQTA